MVLPLLVSFLATLAAAVMAYGTDPRWIAHPWGLGLIVLSRHLQWPLVATSLVLCLALLGLVISGKRRAWWLIALAPVLALFVHRFMTAPTNRYAVLDEPAFVAAADAKHVRDEDFVVGVVFNDQTYAYPYAALWASPVIVQSDRQRRMLLIWSAYANAATPLEVSRDVKARDLDIVCDPADTLLIHNGRTGEFVVGLTGMTTRGAKPAGVETMLPATNQTWKQWRAIHPDTRVLAATSSSSGPVAPLTPRMPAPNAKLAIVIVSHGDVRLAIRSDDIGAAPLNLKIGDVPAVVFRDRITGEVRAFNRRLEDDLIPQFRLPRDAKQKEKGVAVVDADTNTGWSARGVAVDGSKDWRGKKLTPLEVREDLYLGPAQFWYANLPLYSASALAPATAGR
ncbi:MAG: hypothetical protein QOE14_671 [Humisphaera sp.]|nr:hypothetical protein [Humisphaera sp.]